MTQTEAPHRDPHPLHLSFAETIEFYKAFEIAAAAQPELVRRQLIADYGRKDLFFLLIRIIGRTDLAHPWLFERCREVQQHPDGHIDLWAREHYKSTIITFGLTIQNILKNPEITICIFSHTRPLAKAFLRQIKNEFETNISLKYYYSDVLYETPKTHAPKWSEDDGIVVRRNSNAKEATVEAYGLVDGMPTSKHYALRIYDDVVVKESVTSPDMVKKVDYALALSVDLGTVDGVERFVGTRYAAFDSYRSLIDKKVLIPRIHPACPYEVLPDGKTFKIDFNGAYLRPAKWLQDKYAKQGSYVFACQQLLNPLADSMQTLSLQWLQIWDADTTDGLSICIIVDPASGRRALASDNDYTTMWVLGRSATDHWYLIDGLRERLNLTQRCEALMNLYFEYRPIVVFYEQYGMQADIEHIKYVQNIRKQPFEIVELSGSMPKSSRIGRLTPVLEAGRLWIPRSIVRNDPSGNTYNLIKTFLEEEYSCWPVVKHDDGLDSLSRIEDEVVKQRVPMPTVVRKSASSIAQAMRKAKNANRPVV